MHQGPCSRSASTLYALASALQLHFKQIAAPVENEIIKITSLLTSDTYMPQVTAFFAVSGPIRFVVRLAMALVDLLDIKLFNVLVGDVLFNVSHAQMFLSNYYCSIFAVVGRVPPDSLRWSMYFCW